MASIRPTEAYRSRPLPATPSSSPLVPTSGPQPWSRSVEDSRRRNSIFTIASIGTTLPRYSTVDFADPDFWENVENWSETDTTIADSMSTNVSLAATTFPINEPPGYSPSSSARPETSHPAQPTRSPAFVLHKFHIGGGGNKIGFGKQSAREPWATMKLLSRAPLRGTKAQMPRFTGGDSLRGCVDLQLEAPMSVHSIKLLLRAEAQIEEDESTSYPVPNGHIFLDKSYVIYSRKASGDPRENGQRDASKNKEFNGTLQGSYSFPFSIPFPTFVEWRNTIQWRTSRDASLTVPVLSYDLPPSFREKQATSAIVYELGFVITHGTLRSRSKTMTEFTFAPKVVSPPASEKRQAAYREGAILPGPSADHDGWHALPMVVVRGQFLGRPAEVTCILYLAKPLSYTRGTVIPCYISLSCLDSTFLEALTAPRVINFSLFRNLYSSIKFPGKGKERAVDAVKFAREGAQVVHIAKAVWWKPPKTDAPPDLKSRYLEGEVHLPRTMVSSCDFPLFKIEYMVELLPFALPSFTPTRELPKNYIAEARESKVDKHSEPLVKQVVEITGFHEHGPVPTAFTT